MATVGNAFKARLADWSVSSSSLVAIALAAGITWTAVPASAEMLSPDPKAAEQLSAREAEVPENPL